MEAFLATLHVIDVGRRLRCDMLPYFFFCQGRVIRLFGGNIEWIICSRSGIRSSFRCDDCRHHREYYSV